MPFALNVMTLKGLWTLAAILFQWVKYHFSNDYYFVFSRTASLSCVVICCSTVAIVNVSLLVELGACADRPVLRIGALGPLCINKCYFEAKYYFHCDWTKKVVPQRGSEPILVHNDVNYHSLADHTLWVLFIGVFDAGNYHALNWNGYSLWIASTLLGNLTHVFNMT
jgi:hypothetical protein